MENVSQNTDIVRPIATRAFTAPVQKYRSLERDVDGLVFIIAAACACLSFGLAAYFFYGFTQTDQGFWTLASAFGVCFGVGILAFGPCFLTARLALKSRKGLAGRRDMALALLLMLPWVCVSLIFVGFSALPKLFGTFSLFISVSLCFWAYSRLRRLPKD